MRAWAPLKFPVLAPLLPSTARLSSAHYPQEDGLGTLVGRGRHRGRGDRWWPRPCCLLRGDEGRRAVAAQRRSVARPTIVQDDAQVLHRSTAEVRRTIRALAGLGVDWLRVTANWSFIAPSPQDARRPSFDARDPAAYPPGAWAQLDRAVREARAAGLRVTIDIAFWAPRWAVARPSPEPDRQRDGIDAREFGAFAEAVARRYRDGAVAYTIWNEPNYEVFLRPQWRRAGGGWEVASADVLPRAGVRGRARHPPPCARRARADRRHGGAGHRLSVRRATTRCRRCASCARWPASTTSCRPVRDGRLRALPPAPRRRLGAPSLLAAPRPGCRRPRARHRRARRPGPARRPAGPARRRRTHGAAPRRLGHRVRLPDRPARPDAARDAGRAGALDARGGGDRPRRPARALVRPVPLPRPARATGRHGERALERLAVGPRAARRDAQAADALVPVSARGAPGGGGRRLRVGACQARANSRIE